MSTPGASTPGHPQSGSAVYYSCLEEPHSHPKTLLLSSSHDAPVYERFGATSWLGDVDADGEDDAVVCATSFGGENVGECDPELWGARAKRFTGGGSSPRQPHRLPAPDAQEQS